MEAFNYSEQDLQIIPLLWEKFSANQANNQPNILDIFPNSPSHNQPNYLDIIPNSPSHNQPNYLDIIPNSPSHNQPNYLDIIPNSPSHNQPNYLDSTPNSPSHQDLDVDQDQDVDDDQDEDLDLDQDEDEDLDEISDCESVVSNPEPVQAKPSTDDLIVLREGDRFYDILKRRFLAGLDHNGIDTTVVSIRKISFSSYTGKAKALSFKAFVKATEQKCGGDANLRYAWYGASKDEILKIVRDGFDCFCHKLYGHGVFLATDDSSKNCVKSSVADENGIKHMLLCRVITANMDQSVLGSEQSDPSIDEIFSGVDNLNSPNKYVVSSRHMNTHILPEYMISFRSQPRSGGMLKIRDPVMSPKSPWMPFSVLIAALAKLLPLERVLRLYEHYKSHRKGKISRHELIFRIRAIAGDELLIPVIKSYKHRQDRKARGSSSTSIPNEHNGEN